MPSNCVECNEHMNGVDLVDILMWISTCTWWSIKWYRRNSSSMVLLFEISWTYGILLLKCQSGTYKCQQTVPSCCSAEARTVDFHSSSVCLNELSSGDRVRRWMQTNNNAFEEITCHSSNHFSITLWKCRASIPAHTEPKQRCKVGGCYIHMKPEMQLSLVCYKRIQGTAFWFITSRD